MAKKWNRKIVQILSWFLNSVGLNVSARNMDSLRIPIHIAIFGIPAMLVIVCTAVFAYINRHDFNKAVAIAAYTGSTLIIVLTIPKMYQHRKDIATILEKMDSNVFTYYSDEEHIYVEHSSWLLYDEYYSTKLLLVTGYACFGFGLGICSPIAEFYVTRDWRKLRSFPAWYPWSSNTFSAALVTHGWQAVSAFNVFWYYYLFNVLSYFLTEELVRQKDKLCAALSSVRRRTNEAVFNGIHANRRKSVLNLSVWNLSKEERSVYDKVYRENVVECFRHYQEILRIFDLLKPWFTFFFTVEVAISGITFAFVFYNLTEFPQPERILTLVGSSINVVLNLFTRCVVGEVLQELNEDIVNSLFYNVNWYEQSKENKRLLKMFHLLAKLRSNKITAFSVFPASHDTFAKLMRVSYSYMGLIKASLKHDK